MLYYGVSMDLFLSQFMHMVKSIIVKRSERAAAFETAEIKRDADRYIAMVESGNNWNSFSTFDKEVMEAAGLGNAVISAVQGGNKEAIPYEIRELVCSLQKEFVISGYVEKNDYYRMLNGEPPYNEDPKNYVYLPTNELGLPTDIPIHMLTDTQLDYYNNSELRNKLYEANPDKEYLLHMGYYSISYYKARVARNYDILYIETPNNKSILEDFIKNYGASRNYVMIGLYNKGDQSNYKHYDSFMGLTVLAMAIQKTFATIFQQGITRDFYDNNLIRLLFQTYNIPYFESIDVSYQKIIAKQLNVLLQKKSSNEVLFDVAGIFNFRNINIYKYYLLKDYNKDVNGNPIICYKEIIDEEGNTKTVLDYEKTFEVYFQKVNIDSDDPLLEMTDTSNRVQYEQLTESDPYWIEDADLINKMYTSKYNAILTKYMSIEISYELAKLMYETSHGIRMIIDDNKDYKNIKITLPYVVEPVSLFDCVLFLCALTAKKFGMAGNVPLQGYQIAQVYGFNFTTDMDELKANILHDISEYDGKYSKVDPELLQYLKTLSASTLEGAREMYNNIEALRKWLDTAMRRTNNIEAYRAYKIIYNSTLLAEDVQALYTKANGEYANTYLELLGDRRPDLKLIVDSTPAPEYTTDEDGNTIIERTDDTDPLSINNKIDKALEKLSNVAEGLSDMRFANDKSELVSNIEKIINQVKSYTVDQTASGLAYLIDDPHLCLLKLLDYVSGNDRDMQFDDYAKILYTDLFHLILVWAERRDDIKFREKYLYSVTMAMQDMIHFIHDICRYYKESVYGSEIMFVDALNNSIINIAARLNLNLADKLLEIKINEKLNDNLYVNATEMFRVLTTRILREGPLKMIDITESNPETKINLLITTGDILFKHMRRYYEDTIAIYDKISKDVQSSYDSTLEAFDAVVTDLERKVTHSLELKNGMFVHKTNMNSESFSIRDSLVKVVDEE